MNHIWCLWSIVVMRDPYCSGQRRVSNAHFEIWNYSKEEFESYPISDPISGKIRILWFLKKSDFQKVSWWILHATYLWVSRSYALCTSLNPLQHNSTRNSIAGPDAISEFLISDDNFRHAKKTMAHTYFCEFPMNRLVERSREVSSKPELNVDSLRTNEIIVCRSFGWDIRDITGELSC